MTEFNRGFLVGFIGTNIGYILFQVIKHYWL